MARDVCERAARTLELQAQREKDLLTMTQRQRGRLLVVVFVTALVTFQTMKWWANRRPTTGPPK